MRPRAGTAPDRSGAGGAGAVGDEVKTVARNKRARHDYHIGDRVEAGIVLKGTEVK